MKVKFKIFFSSFQFWHWKIKWELSYKVDVTLTFDLKLILLFTISLFLFHYFLWGRSEKVLRSWSLNETTYVVLMVIFPIWTFYASIFPILWTQDSRKTFDLKVVSILMSWLGHKLVERPKYTMSTMWKKGMYFKPKYLKF